MFHFYNDELFNYFFFTSLTLEYNVIFLEVTTLRIQIQNSNFKGKVNVS